MRRALMYALLAVALGPGPAVAVTQHAMQEAAWNLANAQRSAPHHVQIAIDGIQVVGVKGSTALCVIHGKIARSFRGSLRAGTAISLRDQCILSEGAPIGGVIVGFLYDRLKQASHLEVYLDIEDGLPSIPGGAGWIIEEPSATPLHPAPEAMPPRPQGSWGATGQ